LEIHLRHGVDLLRRITPFQRGERLFPPKMTEERGEIRHAVGLYPIHQGDLRGILPGKIERNPEITSENSSRDGSTHSPKPPVQSEFTQKESPSTRGDYLSLHRQSHRYGEIQQSPLLGDIRRSKINGDTPPKGDIQAA
jgi:hypothetical protein